MARPHVVVDALFIDYSDMSGDETSRLFDRIAADLKRGQPWLSVYTRYSDEFGYKTSNRTSVGNLGHLVVFPDPKLGHGHYKSIGPHTIQWQGEPLPRHLHELTLLRRLTFARAASGTCGGCRSAA